MAVRSLQTAVAVLFCLGLTHAVIPLCQNIPQPVPRFDIVCPPRAVCADEWNTIRDWQNGVRCRDSRIIHNCLCPSNTVCPVGNMNHTLYSNDKHTQYTCEPKCGLSMCNMNNRAAEEMVENASEFNYNNYYRVNCRCPGHHTPMTSNPGQVNRATSFYRHQFDFSKGVTYHQYRCSIAGRALSQVDPCA